MTTFPKLRSTIEGGAYISAYIDLLGLSKRLLDLENSALHRLGNQEVLVRARDSIGAIARLRSSFQEWYMRFSDKAKERAAPGHLSAEQLRLFEESKTHKTFFSVLR